MVRKGLSALIKTTDGLETVGEAEDGEQAIKRSEELEPDVILMDLAMPKVDGVSAIAEIIRRRPEARIIALTSFQEEDLVHRALKSGAISYLTKDVGAQDLKRAIFAAHAGKSTLSPEATRVLIRGERNLESKLGDDLTSRELEVLTLIAEGLSNPGIARRISISRATVSIHVSNILSKLGAANRVEATSMAIRHRLID